MPTIKGYTNPDRVARYLGVTLSAAQVQEAEYQVAAAEAWIDERLGRAWGSAAIVNEAYYAGTPNLYLRSRPVASVQSVTARSSMYATPDTALVLATDYEVRDLESGWLYLPGGYYYDRVLVSYTPAATVPQHVALAATMLAAHWLQPAMTGMIAGIQSYSVGQELQVTFAASVAQYGVPSEVLALLGSARFQFA